MEEDKKLSPGPELSADVGADPQIGPQDSGATKASPPTPETDAPSESANAPPVDSGTPPDEAEPVGAGVPDGPPDEAEPVGADPQIGPPDDSLPPAGEGAERSEADEGESEPPSSVDSVDSFPPEGEAQEPPAEAANAPPDKAKKKKKSGMALALRDFVNLLIKLVFILLVVTIAFTFLFGAFRNADPGMLPSIKDGDLVFYYRLDKFYHNSDVLVAKYNDRMICLRVIAVEGDVVDINENGLYINGSLQLETNIYEKTYRFEEGVDFPVTVREGEVFVLGDARKTAADSRVFGPIQIDDTLGKVMAIFRRRSI